MMATAGAGAVAANALLPPTPPPGDSVYAWYCGDNGLVADVSGQVTAWRNVAATGNPASRNLDRISGNPESIRCSTPAGVRNVLRCDGTDGVWGASANFGTLTGSRTFAAYCRLTSTNDGFLFDGSANAPGLTRAQVRLGWWQVGLQPSGSGSNADPPTLPATVNEWHVHFFIFEPVIGGTRVTHAIDGTNSVTYTNSIRSGLGGLILGQNVAASRGLRVDLAEFLVCDRVVGQDELDNLAEYLVVKWGEPVELPPAECAVEQTSQVIPSFGLHALLHVMVRGPGTVTNMAFNLDGTSDLTDVAGVEVYFTGSSAEFRPLHRFGSRVHAARGTLRVDGHQELEQGVNHFWVVIEPRRSARWGGKIDGALLSVGLTEQIRVPESGTPDGELTIGNGIFSTVVRKAGDDGVHTYRIPGLATTPKGTLIAVFDLRWDSANDLPANIDVGCMRSTDNGNTWYWATNTKAILDFDKNIPGSSGNGVGDPAILVDRETGAVWVAALWSYGNHGYTGSGGGLSTNQTGQYVLTRSDDDGLSWSPPINITAQAKVNSNWGVCFQAPGHGIQLRDGTLVFPSQHTDPGGVNARAFFIYSTNHGASWLVSPDVNSKIPPQLNENQMVELNSGRILASCRAPSGGGGKRVWSTYTPGVSLGNGSWSSLTYLLPDPVCQASLIRYSSTLDGSPRDRLLFANPASQSARVQMTIRMSEDEGQTWTVSRQIDSRPAAYSDMAVLADGTVGLLYETGTSSAYDTLTFLRFHLDWLTQADLDSDGDGMSDYYEKINGLNGGANDADEDADGDGASNVMEFNSYTMANDPRSVLRFQCASIASEGLKLSWATVAGVWYSVDAASDLSGDWLAVDAAADILASGPSLSLVLPVLDLPIQYFRVRVVTSAGK